MRVTITGATGLIGRRLVSALVKRGDEVTALSRHPEAARTILGVEALRWDPVGDRAPASAIEGRDAIVHLAGEPVAQRWTQNAKRDILKSRELGTRNLVASICSAQSRPSALVSASAVGYYGDGGEEVLTEDTLAEPSFLATVCHAWEWETRAAEKCGVRVARMRTGVVLDKQGGALAKMLPFFKLGIGGPVAGGKQRLAWIHADDAVAMYLRAIDDPSWSGAFNLTAPDPPTNTEFSETLGRVLRRPARLPVPAIALRALYGAMAQIVTESQRAVPRAALERGFEFEHADLESALRDALT